MSLNIYINKKFKSEIALLKSRANRYEKRFLQLDTEMLTYLTQNYDEKISTLLTEEWSNDCKTQEKLSVEIYNKKENWFLNNAFENNHHDQKQNREQVQTKDDNQRSLAVNNTEQGNHRPQSSTKIKETTEDVTVNHAHMKTNKK